VNKLPVLPVAWKIAGYTDERKAFLYALNEMMETWNA
jgi:hypothetical protein